MIKWFCDGIVVFVFNWRYSFYYFLDNIGCLCFYCYIDEIELWFWFCIGECDEGIEVFDIREVGIFGGEVLENVSGVCENGWEFEVWWYFEEGDCDLWRKNFYFIVNCKIYSY